MLDLMLGNASDAFSCGEVSAWFRPWRRHHFRIDCPCREKPCPVWEKIKCVSENQFHATVIKELGVNFVIDSSKDLCWLIDVQEWAASKGIRTFNLLLWKNPIDLAYSYWKRVQDLTYWRSEFVNYYSKVFEIGLHFVAVNYNDLVNKPQYTVGKICATVGMPYFEGKERFWEKEHHHLFGSGEIRRQVEAGNSTINAITTFPQEFETHIDFLQKQVAADSRVQQILGVLRRADVSLIAGNSKGNKQFLPKKPYPLWYYRKRAIRLFRRYFPEKFDPAPHVREETVTHRQ